MRLDFAGASASYERTRTSLGSALAWLGTAMQIYRERRALRALSDATLKDIGLSRADVERESGRPFWDIGGTPR